MAVGSTNGPVYVALDTIEDASPDEITEPEEMGIVPELGKTTEDGTGRDEHEQELSNVCHYTYQDRQEGLLGSSFLQVLWTQ